MIICTGDGKPWVLIPMNKIRVGQVIVRTCTTPRGRGTLGIAFDVYRVIRPAAKEGKHWVVRCRGDLFYADSPQSHLPVARWTLP